MILRPEIKEWLKKYCKLHSFRIAKPPIWDEKKKRWGLPPYVTQSWRNNNKPFSHALNDKVTRAFVWIKDHSNGQNK